VRVKSSETQTECVSLENNNEVLVSRSKCEVRGDNNLQWTATTDNVTKQQQSEESTISQARNYAPSEPFTTNALATKKSKTITPGPLAQDSVPSIPSLRQPTRPVPVYKPVLLQPGFLVQTVRVKSSETQTECVSLENNDEVLVSRSYSQMSGGSLLFDGWQRLILGSTSRSTSMAEGEEASWP
jgi:hypothetical protein